MIYRSLTLFLFVCSLSLNAQVQLEWANTLTKQGSKYTPWDVCTDDQNNVYLIGSFEDSIDLDPGPGIQMEYYNGRSAFLQKFDPQGKLIFGTHLTDTFMINYPYTYGVRVKVDPFGNIYTTGYGSISIDINPDTGQVITTAGYGAFIQKFDGNGRFLWAQGITHNPSDGSRAYDLAIENDGDILVTGWIEDNVDFIAGSDSLMVNAFSGIAPYLAKYKPNGDLVWVKSFSTIGSGGATGEHSMGTTISLDDDGNIYLAGKFEGASLDTDPDTGVSLLLNATGFEQGFLIKLDSAGNFVWSDGLGQINEGDYGLNTFPWQISTVVSQSNEVIVQYLYGINRYQTRHRKYSAQGDTIYEHVFDGMQGTELAIDEQHNVYATGNFLDSTDVDPGPDSFYVNTVHQNDIVGGVVKLDTSGEFVWAGSYQHIKQISGSSGRAMAIDDAGNILLASFCDDSTDVDPDNSQFLIDGDQVVLVKWSQDSCVNFRLQLDSFSDVTCQDSGYLEVIPLGGIPPISYKWSADTTARTSKIVLGDPGNYFVTATDSLGCTSKRGFHLAGPTSKSNYDLRLKLIDVVTFPNGQTRLTVSIKNLGCLDTSGYVVIYPDPLFHIDSTNPVPDIHTKDSLVWNFAAMNIDSAAFIIQIYGQPDTSLLLGDLFSMNGVANFLINDYDTSNNRIDELVRVRRAYDPNDKQVNPKGACNNGFITRDEVLTYTIRFQNTGEAPAIDVYILDTLDSDLNMSTFSVVESSHQPMLTEILNDSIIRFSFDDIYLPDSGSDYQESQGFVVFNVDQQPSLPVYTEIQNSASIYFDFNPPIKTNSTLNTIIDSIPVYQSNTSINKCLDDTLQIEGQTVIFGGNYVLNSSTIEGCDSTVFLNVIIDQATSEDLQFSDCQEIKINDQVYSNSGLYVQTLVNISGCDSLLNIRFNYDSLIYSVAIQNESVVAVLASGVQIKWLDCNNGFSIISGENQSSLVPRQNGSYAIEVAKDGCRDTSACFQLTNASIDGLHKVQQFQLFPNPANDELTIVVQEQKGWLAKLSVVDFLGRTVLRQSIDSNISTINISDLSDGVYQIVITGEKDHRATFIKQ